MDPNSSGEDLVIKTRKPYTITKQRERWTEEEHDRFLKALKLYGRAWQRIEEHIGTKTAVQIRSHAQKFFTKLEKESIVKGVPIGQPLDIEIPPPRPKRKPSFPYPRKTSVRMPTSQVGLKDGKISNTVSTSSHSKTMVALEKEPEKLCDDEKLGNSNEYHDKDNCSEFFALVKTGPCASPFSANKISSVSDAPRSSCTFRQYAPLSKGASNQNETSASKDIIEANGFQIEKSGNKRAFEDNPPFQISNFVNLYSSQDKSVHSCKRIDELGQSENADTLLTADVQVSQNYPRHVPVHILDGSLGLSSRNLSLDMSYTDTMFHQMDGVNSHQNLFMNPPASATSEHYSNASRSSVHQSFPGYYPVFAPIQNQDDYQSLLQMSTTFSSLIVSALSQNPPAYAAASFGASLWQSANIDPSVEPTASVGAFQPRPRNTTPSMAAIVAATVAAATAWWAAHGLLPVFAPFHPGFTCSPASASVAPTDSSQGRVINIERRGNSPDPAVGGQQLEPECSEALHERNSVPKSPILSSSDSAAGESPKLNAGIATCEAAKVEDIAELNDANKSKDKKLVDRSSCGSNTSSSGEVEAGALEKYTKGKEEKHTKDKEAEERNVPHPVGDPFSRRSRSISNVNDSWKEVSEEGRLAFQALFSRERLPQSFSPPHDVINKGKRNGNNDDESEKDETELQIGLHGKSWGICSWKQGVEDNTPLFGANKEGLLNVGLGYCKQKTHRTGFKPYKRCSVEAECRLSANYQDEERGPKRLCVEEEAST